MKFARGLKRKRALGLNKMDKKTIVLIAVIVASALIIFALIWQVMFQKELIQTQCELINAQTDGLNSCSELVKIYNPELNLPYFEKMDCTR